MTNLPASHGQWGGYRTTKAIASIINVAPNAWLARYGDQTSNPIPLAAAKSKAMAMAKGACGDYAVTNPIAHHAAARYGLSGPTPNMIPCTGEDVVPGLTIQTVKGPDGMAV